MISVVIVSHSFKREAKILVKKYVTLRSSIDTLIDTLIGNPYYGEAYGNDIFKVR